MNFKIIYEDDTELAEWEAVNKGYRADVVVCIGAKEYQVYVTSLIRLQQDFETELQYYGFYQPEPNMILVQNTTREEIEFTITKLYEQKYFERLEKSENT